ncbi:hypothetical protein KP79_PYT24046 [Mizuhopecten yessoensis]|uniref:Uncharacterized protein n=1 Tax=Mizuhopecten yessoensis TaxID=6573 RepID=A0A210Q7F5_MIZYE|nr:hypothetical protein KP79_PYT24046 [Mizuhopecten yessoensis]
MKHHKSVGHHVKLVRDDGQLYQYGATESADSERVNRDEDHRPTFRSVRRYNEGRMTSPMCSMPLTTRDGPTERVPLPTVGTVAINPGVPGAHNAIRLFQRVVCMASHQGGTTSSPI